ATTTFGTPKEHETKYQFKPGIQLGFGLAPMAPYKRPYWQAEIYTSYYEQNSSTNISGLKLPASLPIGPEGRKMDVTINAYDSLETRKYLSIQIPLQMRYNINAWISVGAGVSLRKDFNTSSSNQKTYYYMVDAAQGMEERTLLVENDNLKAENSVLKYNPFFDINIGRVYMGPAIGFRVAYDKNQKSHSGIYGIWRF